MFQFRLLGDKRSSVLALALVQAPTNFSPAEGSNPNAGLQIQRVRVLQRVQARWPLEPRCCGTSPARSVGAGLVGFCDGAGCQERLRRMQRDEQFRCFMVQARLSLWQWISSRFGCDRITASELLMSFPNALINAYRQDKARIAIAPVAAQSLPRTHHTKLLPQARSVVFRGTLPVVFSGACRRAGRASADASIPRA